jgi:uncharacterized protein
MFIDIHELEKDALEFEEVIPPGRINYGSEVRQVEPMEIAGAAELLGDEIHITGSLNTAVETTCDRCLETSQRPMELEFDLFYRPMKTIAHEEEIEIKPSEMEIGFYEGGGLELDDVLREQVLLALPMKRVCREDCKGLCPQCGKNLNQGPCSCKTEKIDARLAGLEKFRQSM